MSPSIKQFLRSSAEKLSHLVKDLKDSDSSSTRATLPSPPLSPPKERSFPNSEQGRLLEQRQALLQEADDVTAFAKSLALTIAVLPISQPQVLLLPPSHAASNTPSLSSSPRPSTTSTSSSLLELPVHHRRRTSSSNTKLSNSSQTSESLFQELDIVITTIMRAGQKCKFVRNSLKKLKEDSQSDVRLGRGNTHVAHLRIEVINTVAARLLSTLETFDASLTLTYTTWHSSNHQQLALLFPLSDQLEIVAGGKDPSILGEMETKLTAQGDCASSIEVLKFIGNVGERIVTIDHWRETVRNMMTECKSLSVRVDRDVSALLNATNA